MSTTYTNGQISIQKDLIFGWAVLVEGAGGAVNWLPFSEIDSAGQRLIQERLTDPIFPQEARDHMKAAREAVADSEFPVTVMNTLENWKILEELGLPWVAENEGIDTMDAVFSSEANRELAKNALKASSQAYPDV